MGVTIHYEGRLRSARDLDQVIRISCKYARKYGMEFRIIEKPIRKTVGSDPVKDWKDQGAVHGIIIQPDNFTDPLWLVFDENLFLSEFCKTQFADAAIHVRIIGLFRMLEPCFCNLSVTDEGGYWETNDLEVLQKHIILGFDAIENAKREDPKLSGPYKERGGRIVDLVSRV
jgi:hypothetical protein